MNEQVIKELLEQLQQNLKKIETAREQVEKTVKAYEALKEDVKHYTEELSFIVQNTRTMISQLEEIKEKFLGNISVTIIEEIKAAVRIITEQTNALSSQVSSVYDLVDSRSQAINSNINNRSDAIDTVLGGITAELNVIKNSLDTITSNEDRHFKELSNKFDIQEKHINKELSIVRRQNIILFAINTILLLIIIGFVLHLVGIV